MSENVFNIIQLGRQSGTFAAPGAAAAATFVFPVEDAVAFELERGSAMPVQHVGRNVRNRAGSGYHGVRRASTTLQAQLRFEDILDLLEMSYAGGVTPTGAGPYTWVYKFEAGSPSLVPYTIEGGDTDAAQAQERLRSCLINSLTMGFGPVKAGEASPWTVSAEIVAFDREINALTSSLDARTGLETVQGNLTRLYEGSTATAFAALVELGSSLRSFTMTATRSLALRAYGSDSDLATSFGFSDLSNATFEAQVAVSATSKSDFHDIWNAAAPASLGERRWRIKATGTGTKELTIDGRVAIMGVPYDEDDGERLFKVTGEFVDDSTLDASHTVTVVNSIATLT